METREQVDRAVLARQEFEGADFGDARLSARLGQLVGALAARPAQSLPVSMGSQAALEATYRFLGNKRISPAAILAPHIERTHERCRERGPVLAVFDTSELRFGGEREQLGHLTYGRGLLAHVGLAVSADGRREPLGMLHQETIVRKGDPKKGRRATGKADNERLRWNRGVAAVHQALPQAICVMDREADVFELRLRNGGTRPILHRARCPESSDSGGAAVDLAR
jgi:hypothetical protein